MFSLLALVAASNATEAGSPLTGPVTTSTFNLCAQVCSCSTAAARKVSAAANKTDLFSPFRCETSLAVEVVFPVPLTPTIITVVGRSKLIARFRSLVLSQFLSAVIIASDISSLFVFLAISIISPALFAPKSAAISES